MSTLELIHKVYPEEISLSPAQVAKILNCHVRSVNRALADGSLPLKTFCSTEHRKRVLISDLASYIDSRRTGAKRGRPIGSKNRKGVENG